MCLKIINNMKCMCSHLQSVPVRPRVIPTRVMSRLRKFLGACVLPGAVVHLTEAAPCGRLRGANQRLAGARSARPGAITKRGGSASVEVTARPPAAAGFRASMRYNTLFQHPQLRRCRLGCRDDAKGVIEPHYSHIPSQCGAQMSLGGA